MIIIWDFESGGIEYRERERERERERVRERERDMYYVFSRNLENGQVFDTTLMRAFKLKYLNIS